MYAGSSDSYVKFSNFFDKVVKKYHGVAAHVADERMNADLLNAPPFEHPDSDMIISTRIRVGRNLAEFPLGPGITDP